MKRKIYILTLLGIFLLSTTGLPMTINMCNMDDMQASGQCKMTMNEMEGKCHEDTSTGDVNVTKDIPPCCQIKIVDNNITDNFISSVNDIGTKVTVKILNTFDVNIFNSEISLSYNIYTSGSPPLISNNHIYLTNSVLLI